MGDETGTYTNMKTDGRVGGKRFIGSRENGCTRSVTSTDMHFTVLPFTNALGEPVMCCVIFTSEKNEIKPIWCTGIDITVDPR
jgi:hypothetical protein